MLNAEFKKYDLNKYLIFRGPFRKKKNSTFGAWIVHSVIITG